MVNHQICCENLRHEFGNPSRKSMECFSIIFNSRSEITIFGRVFLLFLIEERFVMTGSDAISLTGVFFLLGAEFSSRPGTIASPLSSSIKTPTNTNEQTISSQLNKSISVLTFIFCTNAGQIETVD